MKKEKFRFFLNRIIDLVYPPRCAGCSEPICLSSRDTFCPECREKYEKCKEELCKKCGQPMRKCWCGINDDPKQSVNREYHLVQYDKSACGPVKSMIYYGKQYKDRRFFDIMAKEMYSVLYESVCCDIEFTNPIISYAPRQKFNRRKYGHDQSKELAVAFSRCSGFPVVDVLVNRGNDVQKQLSRGKRERNAKKSYRVVNGASKLVKGRCVILIDDVITTGSTAVRCAELLKMRGAEKVVLFTIARTISMPGGTDHR